MITMSESIPTQYRENKQDFNICKIYTMARNNQWLIADGW